VSRVSAIPIAQALSHVGGHVALDSAPVDSPWSRWSYYPSPATALLQCDGVTARTMLQTARGVVREWPDPLDALQWLDEQSRESPSAGPPFKGGWIGYLSYDLGRHFERLPARAADDLRLPLFSFTFHDRVIAVDHASREAYECRTESEWREPIALESCYTTGHVPLLSTTPRPAYESAVRRALDYIAAGDVFQVNLSQRFSAGLPRTPRELYDRLRRDNPAWFGAFLDHGDHALMCNSPELFLRVTPDARTARQHVITRPIKGTRRRGPGMREELLASAKDQAELNMIVDLERNDLGRVCEIGSVRVCEPRTIEEHPTVYHGVAAVEGALREDVTFADLLRATFPGGSITGAPKIRAMEIIEELEPVRRGPYCGAIGYLSVDGHVEFNIAIRTMIAKGDRVYFSVGGGIVADSEPAAEYEETIVKARAMLECLGAA
jgi:para-aminobenzoate synthetase component 1